VLVGNDNLLSTTSNRLFNVPRVAAASANVIIPKSPITLNAINIRAAVGSGMFINNLFYFKDKFFFL
jgi:hypothetical protein